MTTVLYAGNAVKSIPLQNLPEEAWKYITGGDGGAGFDIIKLYETVPWLYRGVEACANAMSGMPYALHRDDADGDELEEKDWPFEVNIRQLINGAYRDYKLQARSYTFINHNVLGTLVNDSSDPALRRYLPTSIEPQYSKMAGLVGFKRKLQDGSTIDLPKEAVAAWFKPPVRTETGFGISDAMVAIAAAGVINNVDEYQSGHFKNGALSPTIISAPTGTQETDKTRLRDWILRRLTGKKNAHKVEVVEGELKAVTFGTPMKDLVTVELTASKREDIATALGVPQTMLFSSAANYATAMQDDLHFYDKTIIPDAQLLEDVWNEMIFHPLGFHLSFHPERMEIYQRLEADKAQSVRTLTDGNIWTRREARVATNMPEEPTKDDPQYVEFTEKPKEKAPVPPELQQQTPDNPAVADETEDDNEFAEEIKRWRVKALNRWNEGKLHKALDFTSDVIPSTLTSAIKGALEGCKSKDAIRDVFDSSLQWQAYP